MVHEVSSRVTMRFAALVALWSAAPLLAQEASLRDQLRAEAHPLADSAGAWRSVAAATRTARVIGLGEATHGQHEAFDTKRRLTLELVRRHGVRVVAYEASASRARLVDDWIQGGAGEVAAAMRGFGMLIWTVEENAALLRDLRAWNASAAPRDRVRFIGTDAQDGEAVAARIRELMGSSQETLARRIDDLVKRAPVETQRLFQGQRAGFDSLQGAMGSVLRDLGTIAAHHPQRAELGVRAAELRAHLSMYGTPGGRDRALADLLLVQLQPGERAVFWGHNAHIKRSALDYLGSTDLAMGGHLAAALGTGYYAIGFAFGSGGFQANAPDSTGRWGFKRYEHGSLAAGSLEEKLATAGMGDFYLDLRGIRPKSPLHQFAQASHGHRWWGGYNVPDDADARGRDSTQLMQMVPARDYDGIVFHVRTTPAMPMDRGRIIPPRRSGGPPSAKPSVGG